MSGFELFELFAKSAGVYNNSNNSKPDTKYAVIFDMDGVIVDSEHRWKIHEIEFMRELVPGWKEEDHRHITGLSVPSLHRWLVEERGADISWDEFFKRSDRVARKIYEDLASLSPGLLGVLKDLKRRGIPAALASSSPRRWIDMAVSRFKLGSFLEAIASADETPGRAKPFPDLYLLAAAKIEAPPEKCLAVEDSEPGVLSAKRAGMKVVGFRSGLNDDQDLSSADLEIRGFDAFDYGALAARLF